VNKEGGLLAAFFVFLAEKKPQDSRNRNLKSRLTSLKLQQGNRLTPTKTN